MHSILALAALLPSVIAAPLSIRQTTNVCATGVHIIAARGSTEDPGEGALQSLSAQIEAAIPGSTDTAVVYPATLLPYASSEETGVKDMISLIQTYVASCPDARLVLTGYSQGAQIVGDTLGGGSFIGSAGILGFSKPLAEKYRKNILAAVQFGDPARIEGKPYNAGNATHGHGLFPRLNTKVLDTYSGQLKSYCIDGDPVCDEGFDISTHLAEVQTFQNQAASFVIGLAGMK